jgi:L-seryl-tRNA(Ser) seleniumtransferase
MTVFDSLGVPVIINARGPSTRLSGGIMRPEVAAAMVEASQACVDMAALQAAASLRIAQLTGAEAGYVASGAAACLMLAAAACMAGLDPSRMASLPAARGIGDEIVMVRSQRNAYDHAIRAAGATIVEVGLPDRFAGAGVRDAEAWELAASFGDRTAAVFYVADSLSQPPLTEVVRVAHAAGIPVIVDAAAQLPPQSNLRHFIGQGADLVVFSGGKEIGGPQASGFMCGKRELVMSAALQHLDLDVLWEQWDPPASLIDRERLGCVPRNGIGRTCKVGKEEIIGLLAALDLFVAEGDAPRHARWLGLVREMCEAMGQPAGVRSRIEGESDAGARPRLVVEMADHPRSASEVLLALQRGSPAIHAGMDEFGRNAMVFYPMCLRPGEAAAVGQRIRTELLTR